MPENQTPVKGVAERYASALFDLAEEAGSLEPVEKDLKRFESVLMESSDLMRLVRSPVFTAEEKINAMRAVLEKLGISGLVLNFILLVSRNSRLFVLPGMIRWFYILAADKRGQVSVDVRSAIPLSEANKMELKNVLKKNLKKDVMINTIVDTALLGGIVVKVGSKMIDASIRTKLNSLKFAMKEVG